MVVGVGAGLGYWYRLEVISGYASTSDAAVSALGLGLAPAALWAVVFIGVLVKRRSWFRRANLWIGSLVFLAFTVGVMSFFQSDQGALAGFTLDGEVSLGGRVGETLAGATDSNALLRGVRVAAVFLIGMAIVAPMLTLDMATWLGRGLGYMYLFSVIAARSLFATLRRLFSAKPKPAHEMDEGTEAGVEPLDTGVEADPRPWQPAVGAPTEGGQLAKPDASESGAIATSGAALTGGGALTETQSIHAPLARASKDSGALAEVSQSPSTDLVAERGAGAPQVEVTRSLEAGEGPPASLSGDQSAARMLLGSTDTADPDKPIPNGTKYNKFWNGSEEGEAEESEAEAAGPSWEKPSIDLLEDANEGGISQEQMVETAETIKRTLAEYDVEVEIGDVKPGPAVTMYGLIPGWVRRYKQVKVTDEQGRPKLDESGKPTVSRVETRTRVKVDSIMSREKDLSLALKTPSLRIETPVLGKALVGIEVPNPTSTLVALRNVMESEEFKRLRSTAKLPIALGKGSGGEALVVDLAKMPHLLVAGATGSGKSVFLNTILSCLLMEKSPEELRLLLVDPKRVELTPYNGIPHLLTPVVVETDQVVALLKGLIREMLDRYRQMEEVGARNIDIYNSRVPDKMPYLVVAVDELADLMMSASFDVEQSLCRLAQLGRATGIHLIVATQRPSVDVVTGLIKANFPSRVAFGVTSQIDSRTILDTAGAERLLGRGDMLYLAVDASRPERSQGVFISDAEIDGLVNFWRTTPSGPLPKVSLHTVGDGDVGDRSIDDSDAHEDKDQLLDKAIEMAYQQKKISTSLLQRRLRIGYPRAARLMDQLEDEGIVGPSDGSKSRDVIISAM